MKRIFISHSSLDGEVASKVCAIMESKGDKCWIAPRDINYGEHWAREIADGLIENTRIFVFLLSENSNKSKQVLKEINLAISFDIPMLVIKLGDVRLNSALLYYLSDIHIYSCSSDNVCQEIADLIVRKEQFVYEKNKKKQKVLNINILGCLKNKFSEMYGDDIWKKQNPIEKMLFDIIGKNLLSVMLLDTDEDYCDVDLEDTFYNPEKNNEDFSDKIERKYVGEWLDPQHGYSGDEGKYFSFTDDEETVTLAYIVNKRINADTQEWWLEPEFLFYSERKEKGKTVRTYWVDNPSSEGNLLILLSFVNNKDVVVINQGFLSGEDIRIGNNPMIVDMKKSQKKFEGEGTVKKFLTDYECGIVIVDPEEYEPIEIQREYNEEKDMYVTYIELETDKTYFTFELSGVNSDTKGKLPKASDFMMGYNYYIGQYGLPQNWLMAAKYLMKSDDINASYYLGMIFLKDKQLHNEDLAKKYLKEAYESGVNIESKLLSELDKQ